MILLFIIGLVLHCDNTEKALAPYVDKTLMSSIVIVNCWPFFLLGIEIVHRLTFLFINGYVQFIWQTSPDTYQDNVRSRKYAFCPWYLYVEGDP